MLVYKTYATYGKPLFWRQSLIGRLHKGNRWALTGAILIRDSHLVVTPASGLESAQHGRLERSGDAKMDANGLFEFRKALSPSERY